MAAIRAVLGEVPILAAELVRGPGGLQTEPSAPQWLARQERLG